MRNVVLLLLVVTLSSVAPLAAAGVAPQPPDNGAVPICATCSGYSITCWANYGVICTPPDGVPNQCTSAWADLLCAGHGGTGPVPICTACNLPGGLTCYANYGTNCTIPTGSFHCTDQQAHDYCPGWRSRFPGRGVSSPNGGV